MKRSEKELDAIVQLSCKHAVLECLSLLNREYDSSRLGDISHDFDQGRLFGMRTAIFILQDYLLKAESLIQ